MIQPKKQCIDTKDIINNCCVMHPKPLEIAGAISDLKLQNLKIPEEKNFRINTLNNYGYMFTKFDPLVERLLHSIEINPMQIIFEVGGAYGKVAEAALERRVEKYYLNDVEETHLKLFAKKMSEKQKLHLLQNLYLIPGRCPENVVLKDQSFDAILVNKVLHFLTPETIDAFVSWLYKGLKLNGRIYVFNTSPFHKNHDSLLPDYNRRKKANERFPGYFAEYSESEPAQRYEPSTRPKSFLYMELDTLKKLFLEHGFKIEEEFQLATIDHDHPEWHLGNDMVGLIAVK